MKKKAMFMIDGERHISFRNAAAAALLAREDLMYERRGVLACCEPESDRRIVHAIRSLVVGAKGNGSNPGSHERRVIWIRGAQGRCGAAVLHALRDDSGREAPRERVLLTVTEPGTQPAVDTHVLLEAYGLTAAEARLAGLIAAGHATARCEQELQVKTSTLRSHLNAIYRKTGAHDKADLVRLVLSLCAI